MAMERLLHALLWLPARLPLRVLYLFADVFFVLLYHVVRYRRGVVDGNLAQCFPEKDLQERRRIARSFYRNFADYIVETVKLLHIGDDEIRRRMVFDNLGLLHAHIAAGRSVAVYFGHAGNWEWAPSVTLHMQAAGDEGALRAGVPSAEQRRCRCPDAASAVALRLGVVAKGHSFPLAGNVARQGHSVGDRIHERPEALARRSYRALAVSGTPYGVYQRNRDSGEAPGHGSHLLGHGKDLARALPHNLPSAGRQCGRNSSGRDNPQLRRHA